MTFAIQEVELYLFFCPSLGIPRQGLTISVYRSLLFPDFFPPTGLLPLGNVTLTSDLENCNSLTRIAITIETDAKYLIVFSTSTNLGGVHIGEYEFKFVIKICREDGHLISLKLYERTMWYSFFYQISLSSVCLEQKISF